MDTENCWENRVKCIDIPSYWGNLFYEKYGNSLGQQIMSILWLWDDISTNCYEIINGITINMDITSIKKQGWSITDWSLCFSSWQMPPATHLSKGNAQWWAECLVTQSCCTLCNPVDCSPPVSSVHGDSLGKNIGEHCHTLFQGSSQPRDWTQVFCTKADATKEAQEHCSG